MTFSHGIWRGNSFVISGPFVPIFYLLNNSHQLSPFLVLPVLDYGLKATTCDIHPRPVALKVKVAFAEVEGEERMYSFWDVYVLRR